MNIDQYTHNFAFCIFNNHDPQFSSKLTILTIHESSKYIVFDNYNDLFILLLKTQGG